MHRLPCIFSNLQADLLKLYESKDCSPLKTVLSMNNLGGKNIHTVPLDVTNEAQAKNAFEAAISGFGGPDVLVNNAGYGHVCPVEDTSLADFRSQIETNLFGVIIMTKAVLPYFRDRRAGHIIQVTSIAGRIGPAGRAPYAAASSGWRASRSRCPKRLNRSVSR